MEEKIIIRSNDLWTEHFKKCSKAFVLIVILNIFLIVFSNLAIADEYFSAGLKSIVYITIFCAFLVILSYYISLKTEIVVTDKRVYGRTLFKGRLDIPLDSISSVGSLGGLSKGYDFSVTIASSSGKISFWYIANSKEIHKAVNDLLISRQNARNKSDESTSPVVAGAADEIKKYKELLDQNVISQEEFDAKKKQLLGL